MNVSDSKATVAFAETCGGQLSSGQAITVRSQFVRGCNATSQGDGLWLIEPHDRSIVNYSDMIVLFNPSPETAQVWGIANMLGPFISTSGLTAPDFYIGAVTDDGEGPGFTDVSINFVVKQIPRNR